jgi:hypothetical protein
VPVSDASARRAADWLAAWARAGLLGTDPEVRAYVADLIQFVGERTMSEKSMTYGEIIDEAEIYVVELTADRDRFAARVRELEAENAELRRMLDDAGWCFTKDMPSGGTQ